MSLDAPSLLIAAAEAAATEPLCLACVECRGLCRFHERQVLPQLKQPSWVRLIGVTRVARAARAPGESREARTIRLRKERKRAKKFLRIQRLLAGESAPARPTRSVA